MAKLKQIVQCDNTIAAVSTATNIGPFFAVPTCYSMSGPFVIAVGRLRATIDRNKSLSALFSSFFSHSNLVTFNFFSFWFCCISQRILNGSKVETLFRCCEQSTYLRNIVCRSLWCKKFLRTRLRMISISFFFYKWPFS